jgi:hypothetical protein
VKLKNINIWNVETAIISHSKEIQRNAIRKHHDSSLLRPQVVLLVDFLDSVYTATPECYCGARERLLEPVRAEGFCAAPGRQHFFTTKPTGLVTS